MQSCDPFSATGTGPCRVRWLQSELPGWLRAPCAAVLQIVHGCMSCAGMGLQCAAYRPPVVLWGKPGCAAEVWALLLLVCICHVARCALLLHTAAAAAVRQTDWAAHRAPQRSERLAGMHIRLCD